MYLYVNILQKFIQNLMNSFWYIRIFLGLVPKKSPCTYIACLGVNEMSVHCAVRTWSLKQITFRPQRIRGI
jgi:hypothetical protein